MYLGHNDDVLPRNVVFLECLSEDTLRLSVGVGIGSVKCVDAVLVPVSGGDKRKQRNRNGASELTQT